MRVETNPLEAAYAALLEHGLDGAGGSFRILVNEASKVERGEFLGAGPYERTANRRDYANGFKPKTMLTRSSQSNLPGATSAFRPLLSEGMEKDTRTDQAVNVALAEMYGQGVSSRHVIDILQRLASGRRFHSRAPEVSRAAANLGRGVERLARPAFG